ncbi:hypothetical protein CAP48_14425 [Advenella sp. S44]|nr:hypothetical protein CAP48_14425 [Advenella sp. S44]
MIGRRSVWRCRVLTAYHVQQRRLLRRSTAFATLSNRPCSNIVSFVADAALAVADKKLRITI